MTTYEQRPLPAFAFKLSNDLVIAPHYRPSDVGWETRTFPWLLAVAPIDYKSRLEAALTRVWGVFEEHGE